MFGFIKKTSLVGLTDLSYVKYKPIELYFDV